jgi:hypothetical protein
MSDYRAKLIIGLADEATGGRLHNAVRHVTGSDSALTVSPTSFSVGASTSSIGFFGAAVTAKPSGVTLNSATAIANALANLGLIATTTP